MAKSVNAIINPFVRLPASQTPSAEQCRRDAFDSSQRPDNLERTSASRVPWNPVPVHSPRSGPSVRNDTRHTAVPMAVTKRTRFEVFKRDSFTCQYCGRSAPDVVLEADHIHPRAEGGADDILNLITACYDCNRGKGRTLLTDDQAITRQLDQLKELNERREQLEMLVEWRHSLRDLKEQAIVAIAAYWNELTPGRVLNELGLHYVRGILRRRVYVAEWEVMRLLEDAVQAGADVEDLKDWARACSSWTGFRNLVLAAS